MSEPSDIAHAADSDTFHFSTSAVITVELPDLKGRKRPVKDSTMHFKKQRISKVSQVVRPTPPPGGTPPVITSSPSPPSTTSQNQDASPPASPENELFYSPAPEDRMERDLPSTHPLSICTKDTTTVARDYQCIPSPAPTADRRTSISLKVEPDDPAAAASILASFKQEPQEYTRETALDRVMHMVGCMKADLEQAKASLESEIQSHATTASQRDESSRLCSELTQRIEKLEAEKLQLRADCERFEQTSTDALKTKENLDVEKTKLKADHDYLIQQCINLVASLDQVSAEKEKWKAACEVAERSLDVGKSEREEIEGRLTEMTRVNEELEAERKRFQGIAEEAEESKKLLSQDLRTKTKEGEIMKVVMDKMREMMERSLQDPNIIKKLVAFRKEGFSVDQIAIIAPVADKIADGDSAYTNPQQSLSPPAPRHTSVLSVSPTLAKSSPIRFTNAHSEGSPASPSSLNSNYIQRQNPYSGSMPPPSTYSSQRQIPPSINPSYDSMQAMSPNSPQYTPSQHMGMRQLPPDLMMGQQTYHMQQQQISHMQMQQQQHHQMMQMQQQQHMEHQHMMEMQMQMEQQQQYAHAQQNLRQSMQAGMTLFKDRATLKVAVTGETQQLHFKWVPGTVAFKIDGSGQARIVFYNDESDEKVLNLPWVAGHTVICKGEARVVLEEYPRGTKHFVNLEDQKKATEFGSVIAQYTRQYLYPSRQTNARQY